MVAGVHIGGPGGIGAFRVPLLDRALSNAAALGSTLTLHKDAFSFDEHTTVDKVQDRPFTSTPVTATVLFTGTFKNGRFTGKVHLGGSTCPEASYTAHFSTHGGGSGR
jgi:hypothetical protein